MICFPRNSYFIVVIRQKLSKNHRINTSSIVHISSRVSNSILCKRPNDKTPRYQVKPLTKRVQQLIIHNTRTQYFNTHCCGSRSLSKFLVYAQPTYYLHISHLYTACTAHQIWFDAFKIHHMNPTNGKPLLINIVISAALRTSFSILHLELCAQEKCGFHAQSRTIPVVNGNGNGNYLHGQELNKW